MTTSKGYQGPDICIAPLTGKPKQQRFTVRNGVRTSTDSRRRSVISGRPLPERTNFGPAVAAQQSYLCMSQPAALRPSPCNILRQRLTFQYREYYMVLCYLFTYPGGMEGWVGRSIMSVNNLLKVITRQRSWWELNPRPLSHYSQRPYQYATEPL